MTVAAPSLSVILSAMGSFRILEPTIARLCVQTIRDRMELILVGPPQAEPLWAADLRGRFQAVQIVTAEPFVSIGQSNALGVEHARAEVVVFGEDHCFPEPDWAEALVSAHEGPWAAVGPQVSNANPQSAVSRADFLIGYSPWASPCESGEVDILPGHNSSYKKAVLLQYGDALADCLQAETVLHYDLTRRGKKLYLEGRARTAHVNFSRLSSWITIQSMQGRVFAAERRKNWGSAKRLLFATASPLIPAVRIARITRQYFSAPRSALAFLRTLPHLAFGLALDGMGQFVGYAFGAGNTVDDIATLELQRIDHITEQDRRELFSADPLAPILTGAKQ
jgi:hypothetical protein